MKLVLLSPLLFSSLLLITCLSNQTQIIYATTQSTNSALVTSVTQNLLTVVSFLLGTSSFILGLNIQNVSRLTSVMNKYLKILILALVFPAIFINIYGIALIGDTIEQGDIHYLIILFSLFVPSGAILFLLSKINSITYQAK